MRKPGKIAETFDALRAKKHAAFIPFFATGDPDIGTTKDLVRAAADAGADIIELGVPFSDPIADGPVIQNAFYRALERGFRVNQLFDMVADLRRIGFDTPLVCMVSYTLVYKRSLHTFLLQWQEAGGDGLIIPDLPVGYEGDAAKHAAQAGRDLVFLVAPTTTPDRQALVAERSRGFIYYISVAGVTGARTELPPDLAQNVRAVKALTQTPVCVGFGISRPEQAAAVAQFADGVIVGSALVKKVDEALAQKLEGAALVKHVTALAKELASAAHGGAQ
jgi:tryptophan synthase alpha chain